MLVIPTSRIILLKNPLEIDNKNQLTFSNATAQYNYFSSLTKLECSNATYQRKDDVVRFPTDPTLEGVTYEDLIQYNYCMYQNDKWSNKWFYAFVKKVTYDNPGMSLIELETDVWQSWCFDITLKNSFVEREHVNDDTLGKHTIPEGLDTGEFVINNAVTFDEYATDFYIVAGVSKLPGEIYSDILADSGIPSRMYNYVYSGLTYIAFETYDDATKFTLIMDGQGIAENIYSMFIVPKSIMSSATFTSKQCTGTITIPNTSFSTSITFTIYYQIIPNTTTEQIMNSGQTITINSTLNGYTPKNNKLFTGEFNYMYVTNNAGSNAKYNYEDFYSNTPIFSLLGAITPGCSIRLIPKNYKLFNQSASEDYICNPYGLSAGKYPICSWSSDSYTNWLTQQSVNITTEYWEKAGSIGVLSAVNPVLGATGILSAVKDQMALKEKREHAPVQAKGNLNAGDVTWAMGWNQFVLFQMSVRYEYAKKIDDYFQMFGYRINELKTPSITGRTYWNYVKTIGCNIIGDIPQEDMEKIKSIFNEGCTFWHDTSKFLDYSQSNTIVS